MEENGYRFGVGVLVLASAIIGVLLIAFFGAVPNFWIDRIRITVNFESAPRIAVDTPVRKNGVLIGRVSDITLRRENEGVFVTMEVDRKVELRKGELPRISSNSLITGENVVEFVRPTPESLLRRFDGTVGTPRDGQLDAAELAAANEVITDNTYLRGGEVAKDPLEVLTNLETTFVPVMASMERAMNRFESVGAAFQDAVGDGSTPVRDLVNSTKATMENINTTVNTINRVATQVERAEIPRAVADAVAILPDLFREAQTTLAQTQRTLKGFEQFSASLESLGKEFEGIGGTIREAVENANVAIENIAEITEPVSQNSEVLVANAVRSLESINALAVDLNKFSTRLNNSNGTIAQLVDNPQIGYKVNETLHSIHAASQNIQVLTQKMQPILNDVRIFTDKVARDPGQIGVRGILSNRPLGTGVK